MVPGSVPICVEFVCSSHVCVGSLRVLLVPPAAHQHACSLTDDSKIGLSGSIDGCLSLYTTVMD